MPSNQHETYLGDRVRVTNDGEAVRIQMNHGATWKTVIELNLSDGKTTCETDAVIATDDITRLGNEDTVLGPDGVYVSGGKVIGIQQPFVGEATAGNIVEKFNQLRGALIAHGLISSTET